MEFVASILEEFAHIKFDPRDESTTETFTISKEKGTVYICFESVPIWWTVLSPISFHAVCFTHFDRLDQLINVNNMTSAIFSCYLLNSWPSDRIKLKPDNVNRPSFILASGTKSLLECLNIGGLDVPALWTFEFNYFSNLKINEKVRTCRNFINGGCLDTKYVIVFSYINPLVV